MTRLLMMVVGMLVLLPVAKVRADVLTYLPADIDLIAVFKSKEITQTELLKRVGGDLMSELLKASRQATDAVKASGLDPMKDFDLITVAIDLDQKGNTKPFAVFEGKFDTKQVAESVNAYMAKNPNQMESMKLGENAVWMIKGSAPADSVFMAIIDATKIVVAPTQKAMEDAYLAAAGKKAVTISKDLANLFTTAKTAAPIGIWGWVKGKLGDIKLPNAVLQERIKAIDWMTASVEIAKDVKVNLGISTPNAEAAKQLSDLLGGTMVLLKLQITALIEEQPELLPLLELTRTARFAPSGRYVTGVATIKGDNIEKAIKGGIIPKKK